MFFCSFRLIPCNVSIGVVFKLFQAMIGTEVICMAALLILLICIWVICGHAADRILEFLCSSWRIFPGGLMPFWYVLLRVIPKFYKAVFSAEIIGLTVIFILQRFRLSFYSHAAYRIYDWSIFRRLVRRFFYMMMSFHNALLFNFENTGFCFINRSNHLLAPLFSHAGRAHSDDYCHSNLHPCAS